MVVNAYKMVWCICVLVTNLRQFQINIRPRKVMSMNLTREDFLILIQTSEKWIEKNGLKRWDVEFIFGETNDNNVAECRFNVMARQADIVLARETDDNNILDSSDIERMAFYEITELFLARLAGLAHDAVLRFPTIIGLLTDSILANQVLHRYSAFTLFQYSNDLLFTKTFLHPESSLP